MRFPKKLGVIQNIRKTSVVDWCKRKPAKSLDELKTLLKYHPKYNDVFG